MLGKKITGCYEKAYKGMQIRFGGQENLLGEGTVELRCEAGEGVSPAKSRLKGPRPGRVGGGGGMDMVGGGRGRDLAWKRAGA